MFANICFYCFFFSVRMGCGEVGGWESAKCSGMGVTQAALRGKSGARSGIVVGSACVRFLAL